jgi:hypothetical protein
LKAATQQDSTTHLSALNRQHSNVSKSTRQLHAHP